MDNIQYLKNLVEFMRRRLEAVILNEGNSTKYKPVCMYTLKFK